MGEALTGVVAGFCAAAALCWTWRRSEQGARRAALAALARALAELEASIETIALDPVLLAQVATCRRLVAVLERGGRDG